MIGSTKQSPLNYTLVFSGDPSLALPAFEACGKCQQKPDAPLCPDCVAAKEAAEKERERLLNHARETGDWQSIVREGETPTVFSFAPIKGTAFQWWAGQTQRNQLIGIESASLALRLGLQSVANFGKHKVERYQNADGQQLAKLAIVDAIYAEVGAEVGAEIVGELGTFVIDRARAGISPLSSKG